MSMPHSLIAKHRHEWRDHENDEAHCHRQAGVCEKNRLVGGLRFPPVLHPLDLPIYRSG
jgi:hypothetical protein